MTEEKMPRPPDPAETPNHDEDAPPFAQLAWLEAHHRQGDRNAADRAVLYCQVNGEPWPDWVKQELTLRSAERLELIPKRKIRERRHARNFDARCADTARRLKVYAAVAAARRQGLKGEETKDLAKEALGKLELSVDYDHDSIMKIYYDERGSLAKRDALEVEACELELHLIVCELRGREPR